MSAELGAQIGLVAPDEVTRDWLREAGVADLGDTTPWHSDAGADRHAPHLRCAALAPQVALPHSPANARADSAVDAVPVQVAYIGACTGAKLDDLRAAAACCRSTRRSGVRLMVAPASRARVGSARARRHTVSAAWRPAPTLLPTSLRRLRRLRQPPFPTAPQ